MPDRAAYHLNSNRSKVHDIALAATSLVFAFFWLPVPDLFDVACILLILLFVPAVLAPGNRELRRDPAIILGLCFFLYVLVSIVWHRLTLPENFPPTTSDRRFLRVLYFIAIAYAISRSRLLSAWHLLIAAFGGLLVYLAMNFDPAEWAAAWDGQRVDFGIHNAQHTGVVFATCAMAFSIFTPRFLNWVKKHSIATALIGITLWIAALLLSFLGLFVSQTRGVWLGFSVTVLILISVLVAAYRLRCKSSSISLRKPLLAGLVGIIALGLLAAGLDLPRVVSERLADEKVTWEGMRQAATHQDRDLSSTEVRVASWSAATDWIMERPFMGWGGRGSRPLIRESELFSDEFKKTFNHLHNSYFQVLVEIGLIGAGFISALMVLLGHASIQAYKRRAMPLDVFIFSWFFFMFWLVANLFESYIIYSSGTYLVAIVASFFYSFCIQQKTRHDCTGADRSL